jgi:beta-mannosidase
LWSGDNENDILYYSMGLNPGTNRITREVLPEVVSQCDPFRPFLPSSPYLSPETVARRELRLMPENHLWGPRDYYKSRFYTEHTAHFVSEIGYHGCPGISSIRRFTDAEHVWPWTDNPQWILHSTDMTGDPYRVRLMANQVREMFGEIPDNPGDFIVASQVSQAEAKKFFVEMTRLGRWQRTGVLWWNVMDGWPQFSDAVVDYYFNKKLAYHYLKRVQVPVLVAVDEPADWHVRVTACNDSREAAEGSFSVRDADTDELLLAGDFRAPANTNRELGKIPVARSDKRLLLIRWTAGGKPHANHYLMGSPPFHLAQYRRWMKKIAGLLNDFDPERVGE